MDDNDAVQAVRALFRSLLDAWNAGDARAYAALFANDAHYVAFDGVDQHGRAAIEAAHRPLFERYLLGSRLTGELVDARVLAEGVVLAHAVGSIVDRGRSEPKPERLSSQTLVAMKDPEDSGTWRFVAFHNTRVRPINAGPRAFAAWKLADVAWKVVAPKTHARSPSA